MVELINLLVPLIAVFTGAANLIWSRIVLVRHKVNFHKFLPITFILASLFMLPFLGFIENFSMRMLEPINISLMMGLIFVAYMYNFFFFKGFGHETLCEVEFLMLLVPLFAISLAFFIFPSERLLLPLFLGIIATIVLAWSHFYHGHIEFTKNSKYILLSILFLAIEYMFVKQLLGLYNPFTLYFVRTFFLTILFNLLFPVKFKEISRKSWKYLVAGVMAFVIQYVATFTSVEFNGIVVTNLIMNLLPVTVFTYAYFIYKDNPGWKKIVAGIVILSCILIIQIYG